MSIPQKIQLTGSVCIKYVDNITSPKLGDVMLYLNDDAISGRQGDYTDLTSSGYIKAKVYDGKVWHNMYIAEFCLEKENKFTKTQRAIDSAHLCKAIMEMQKSLWLFKGYRGHFTRNEYEQNPYIRKASSNRG